MTQTILIEKFANKKDIQWRIDQLINAQPIKGQSRFSDEYPKYKGVRSYSGISKYHELEWIDWDIEEFSHIFFLENIWNIDVSKEMLNVLKKSFEIKSWEDSDTNMFCAYLRQIFFKYFEKFNTNLVDKEFYFDILSTLQKFDYKYSYNFNFQFFRDKFWVTKIDEKARLILDNNDIEKIKLLLWASESERNINTDVRFKKLKEIHKYKNKIFTEGITESIYIKRAAELLGKEEILKDFEFDLVWINSTWGSKNCWDKRLKDYSDIIFLKPDHLDKSISKVLFLHDPETANISKEVSIDSRVHIRQMKFLKDRTRSKWFCRSWIEALLSKEILEKLNTDSWLKGFEVNEIGGESNQHIIIKEDKAEIAKWICENWAESDFKWFMHIFELLEEVLKW